MISSGSTTLCTAGARGSFSVSIAYIRPDLKGSIEPYYKNSILVLELQAVMNSRRIFQSENIAMINEVIICIQELTIKPDEQTVSR